MFSARAILSALVERRSPALARPDVALPGLGVEDGGRARGSDNSPARSGRARMAPAGGLIARVLATADCSPWRIWASFRAGLASMG
jgi:hypothetical protein